MEDESSPAVKRPAKRWRWLSNRFLILSLAVHFLFAGGATIWIVQTIHPHGRRMFRSLGAQANPVAGILQHKVQLKQRSAMSAPVAVRHATTIGPSKFVLPAMPIMPPAAVAPSLRLTGMGGAGVGKAFGGPAAPAGFANAGGAVFMASVGGLNIQARRLAVALDVSGSVAQYREALQTYVEKTFEGCEVTTFTWAAFSQKPKTTESIGSEILAFLGSPKNFDSIYVFSDFGETTPARQTVWEEIKKLMRAKKVRLYLHVLRDPGEEGKINPTLREVIAFAESTGGKVKIGGMTHM